MSAKLDESLCIWIDDCTCKHIALSDDIIKQKAERIWIMPQGGSTGPVLQFSNGWLEKFKQKHSFRRISYHGEQAYAATLDPQNSLPIIRIELGGHNVDEIYNADEFGLQYRLPPKDHCSHKSQRLKKDKARINCLACCNASRSDMVPLRIIWNSRNPRVFQRKVGRNSALATEVMGRHGRRRLYYLNAFKFSIRG